MSADKIKKLTSVMALGTFVVVLDNTIMNVSISALVEDLNTTVSGVQAAIALNALMMAAFVLMGGKMADIIGMKKTFLLGAVIYIIGSLIGSFSNNLAIFILGWCAIQGFGAAMMLPNVNTIIRANIKGPQRAKAYGAMAGINALATAVGPIIGGFLTTYLSWRWAFRLEIGILLIVLLSSKVIPTDSLLKARPKLDKVGVAWQAAAMMLLVLGTLAIADYGIFIAKQPFVIGDFTFAPFNLSIVPFLWAAGIICLMMFVRHEGDMAKKAKATLVDLNLFRVIDFVKGLNIRFIHVALIAGTTFTVPLFLQVTFGLSAFETGFILLGLTAGLIITAIGGTRKRLDVLPKNKIRNGFVISIVGLGIMLAYVQIGDAPIGLVPGLFVYGMGLGLIASQIVNLVMSAVQPNQTAEASGVTSTLETLGSSVGTAVMGTILIVAITSGTSSLIQESTVFTPEMKTEITAQMPATVEIVPSDVVADKITEDGAYEQEALRIYETARQNAFSITLLFMMFMSFVAYLLAKRLPAKKIAAEA